MKIALVTNNYTPITSGVTTSVNSYAQSLRELGHSVYVIAPRFPGFHDTDFNVVRTSSLALYYKEKYPISLATPRSLKNIFEGLSIDLVHSQHPFGLGVSAIKAAKFLHIPLVFTYHTIYEEYSHYIPLPNGNFLKQFIKTRAIQYANSANLVICPTIFMEEYLRNSGCRTKLEVLPSPISQQLQNYTKCPDRRAILDKFNITPDKTIFLCVSRLAPEKNVDFLLRAYAVFQKTHRNSVFIIAGDGPQKQSLLSLAHKLSISRSVMFAGILPHSELADLYSVSSALLFSSKTETQGLPLVESLHFNLPIIALESAAAIELVKKVGCGLITRDSEQDFATCMTKMMNNNDLRDRIICRASKLVKNYYANINTPASNAYVLKYNH